MPGTPARPYYQRISYRLLRRLRSTIPVQVGSRKVIVPLVEEAGLYLLHWQYSWKTALISQRLRSRPGALVDVGANVGQTLLDYLWSAVPAGYFGFEPNVTAAAYLARLIRGNQIPDAYLIPAALGNTANLATIHIEPGASAYASDATLTQEFRPQRRFERAFIACYPFDLIRPALAIGRISMVKIDAEHAELMVLQGMKESLAADRPPICCEVLHRDPLFTETEYAEHLLTLERLLGSLDYRILHIQPAAGTAAFSLAPIEQFPRVEFTPRSYDQCDYLFWPNEEPLSQPGS
jgi:FkbM family methyltransferase